ncbi:unnamed protein product [Soboliphyme baturini]|uniref:Secreted protein n=1 Tax=Soboliphyme baturini TaxID=241478 RepID=A0A183IJJ4_9BILA|nr:unnamed protein product [Soboliphyme baturini]
MCFCVVFHGPPVNGLVKRRVTAAHRLIVCGEVALVASPVVCRCGQSPPSAVGSSDITRLFMSDRLSGRLIRSRPVPRQRMPAANTYK